MQIDITAAFNRVNHQGILYWLRSVGIGGIVLSILSQFLPNRLEHMIVNNCWSKLVNSVSGELQGRVLDQLLFLLYTFAKDATDYTHLKFLDCVVSGASF